jgi:hypothetical protein
MGRVGCLPWCALVRLCHRNGSTSIDRSYSQRTGVYGFLMSDIICRSVACGVRQDHYVYCHEFGFAIIRDEGSYLTPNAVSDHL